MPPRKRDRIKAWIRISGAKSKEPDQLPAPQGDPDPQIQLDDPPSLGDRDRGKSKERFEAAILLLDRTLKSCASKLGTTDFPEFTTEPEDGPHSLYSLIQVLESRQDRVQNQSAWSKCTNALAVSFKTLSPFLKTFLGVANQGQSVCLLRFHLLLNLDCGFESLWTTLQWTLSFGYGHFPSAAILTTRSRIRNCLERRSLSMPSNLYALS